MKKTKKKKRKKDSLRQKSRQSSSQMEYKWKLSGRKVVRNLQNEAKMSAVLLEFVEPLMEYCLDDNAFQRMIEVSICTWNLCLLPDNEQKTIKEEMIANLVKEEPEMGDIASAVIGMLIERKKTQFSDIKRTILDYEILHTQHGRRINVMSSV